MQRETERNRDSERDGDTESARDRDRDRPERKRYRETKSLPSKRETDRDIDTEMGGDGKERQKEAGFSCSVVSDSLAPCGLQPARLLCPWDSPGKKTGVGGHALP